MKEIKAKSEQFSELREQAKQFLKKNPVASKKIPPGDIQNLIEELQVHQIELEMQNEELKRTQAALEELWNRYVDLYDFAPTGYFTVDEKGVILEANLSGAALLKQERQFLIGKPMSHFVARDDQDVFYLHCKQVFATNTRQICELKLVKKDGTPFYAQLECLVVQKDDRNFKQCRIVVSDITDRKRAEVEKIRLVKLGALGTLTAGIAHELNNPLMGMLNFVDYCLKDTSRADKKHTVLEDVLRETKRCIDIVQNLLTFSRIEDEDKEAYKKEKVPVIFDRVFKLLSYRIQNENILWTQKYPEELPEIWMKVSNIQQVFLNLIGNSLDAVKETEKKEIHVDLRPEGEVLLVTVADTGCGVSPENLQNIFDPFFTTKPPGKGTGLGLSVCHSIVKAHGGEITCESEVGKGTRFSVMLPVDKK